MIDVSHKFKTLRYAMARGRVDAAAATIARVKERTVPKGDVLSVARSAGIAAAKKTSDWIVFCHSMPLDWVDLHFELAADHIAVRAEVRSVWKTGVEMEALTAVSAALLNMYDMLKPLDEDLSIADIRLVRKRGGKRDFSDRFRQPLRAGVLVISDSTFAGEREDTSGQIVRDFLESQSVRVEVYDVLPDEPDKIKERLIALADKDSLDLVFTTGGTGLGPRDLTPEATRDVIDRDMPGIAEAIRRHGGDRTPFAMLSREVCGVRGKCVIINLPGSSKGAQESMQALFPGLPHAILMLWGLGH